MKSWRRLMRWRRQQRCAHDWHVLVGRYDDGGRYWEGRMCRKCDKGELRLLMTPYHPNCRCVSVPLEPMEPELSDDPVMP